jgi:hypothetical protein
MGGVGPSTGAAKRRSAKRRSVLTWPGLPIPGWPDHRLVVPAIQPAGLIQSTWGLLPESSSLVVDALVDGARGAAHRATVEADPSDAGCCLGA